MRKLALILLIFTLLSSTIISCGRYENGPAFSLRSAKSRAVGEWVLTDLLVNDKSEQALLENESSSKLILNEDGSYSYKNYATRSTAERCGIWTFGEDKTELILTEIDTIKGNVEHSYRITRLTNKEMWLLNGNDEYINIDDLIERRFEKQSNK